MENRVIWVASLLDSIPLTALPIDKNHLANFGLGEL